MSAEHIRRHFVHFLGSDVGVSFDDPEQPRDVILYRPDRLSNAFVSLAFQALEQGTPSLARRIERLLVSFDGPSGPARQGVEIRPVPSAPLRLDAEAAPAPMRA